MTFSRWRGRAPTRGHFAEREAAPTLGGAAFRHERSPGRRIDAAGAPMWADIPDGYDDTGFQAVGMNFPTEGCWEITGKVGQASLTFVALIRLK